MCIGSCVVVYIYSVRVVCSFLVCLCCVFVIMYLSVWCVVGVLFRLYRGDFLVSICGSSCQTCYCSWGVVSCVRLLRVVCFLFVVFLYIGFSWVWLYVGSRSLVFMGGVEGLVYIYVTVVVCVV